MQIIARLILMGTNKDLVKIVYASIKLPPPPPPPPPIIHKLCIIYTREHNMSLVWYYTIIHILHIYP